MYFFFKNFVNIIFYIDLLYTNKNLLNMKNTVTFYTKANLSLQNSYGILAKEDDVELEITIGINSDEYGYFEMYDVETGGENWHAEGGIWFDGKNVIDYDGVFSLPAAIIVKLNELGYNTENVE
jgi:hypothetical protein